MFVVPKTPLDPPKAFHPAVLLNDLFDPASTWGGGKGMTTQEEGFTGSSPVFYANSLTTKATFLCFNSNYSAILYKVTPVQAHDFSGLRLAQIC